MNLTIQQLILQITWLTLQINSQGKWHVFTELSGHCRSIDVRVYAADTDYRGEQKAVVKFNATYEHSGADYEFRQPAEVDEAACTLLQGLLVKLDAYLDVKKIGQQIVAQMESRREVLQ
ncbi:hypothetical protein J3Q00_07455 [Pseudomonas sp. D2-3]